ncbi:hypothetical protein KBY93_08540 [Synechococcus sp. J7-Johnson]|uniref:hypothetical protein n=1 Tax=Synechococcus sp. J7-Johnson TaxID=2823737 RepID=UPI0020CC0CEB|nr:hypothetical protein [Synechococcus sp. J7-Johnson]MCP9840684.1 hypothetical protein [Synechococcus sp. J7-Johnson]
MGEDVNQIATYAQRVKRMVGRVLTVNGVTSYAHDHDRLLGGVAEGFCVGEAFSKRSS